MEMRKVAILGGAFDPITIGHMQLAEYILKNTNIQEVWITPCYSHMFEKKMSLAKHRLKMCQIAINQNKNPNIKIFNFEIKHSLNNGTYDFISNLLGNTKYCQKYKFSYVIGMDNANNFSRWKNSDLLKDIIDFIVISRQGIVQNRDIGSHWYHKKPHVLLCAGQAVMNVSSSIVRNLIRNSQDSQNNHLKSYIIKRIVNYIKDNKLYHD